MGSGKKDLSDPFGYNHCSETLGDGGIVSNWCVNTPPNDVDVFFCFEIVLKTGNLLVAPYSEYQNELHDTIKELHDGGIGYRKIAL